MRRHDEPTNFAELIDTLDLERKVALLSGASAWTTHEDADIGLREMTLSDGPSGVRGKLWDERSTSLLLPSATSLSSSWDLGLARRYGAVSAMEARRKEVDVVLGPMVNLQRSPLGGRSFETFSEDPLLTGDIAVAYIRGVQENGVAACVKAYVANDFETERFTANTEVGQRALHELYLLPFEKAVTEADVWSVMSAYNEINGVTATESPLLDDPLTSKWGFDGVVVSDWTAVRSIASARGRQDLAMPGPNTAWGPALVEAVRSGQVDEAALDAKLDRLLRLAWRVGALNERAPAPVIATEDGPGFARYAAAEGMVLLRNTGPLPLQASELHRVAVLGQNANRARAQGGGSATVMPDYVISPLAGLRAALPESVTVDYAIGAVVQTALMPFEPEQLTNPVTGGPGAQVSYLGSDGTQLFTEERFAAVMIDSGYEPRMAGLASLVYDTVWTPDLTGRVGVGFASPGACRMSVDGELILDATISSDPDQVGGFFDPASESAEVDVVAGRAVRLRFEFTPIDPVDGVEDSFGVWFGTEPPPHDADALIADAVRAARDADVVVVVVGTNAQVECEGFDRTDLRLPGRQDDLVAAVAAVNPNVVVVVNAGAPVELPWRDDVAAVLVSWFAGQEFGNALADVLLGSVEPGGRLPTTWPKTLADVPVSDVTPHDGVVRYDEGIHIGYRAWLRAGTEPAYPFGHGLGYTTWELSRPTVVTVGDGLRVDVELTNRGARPGKQVVQVYAQRSNSAVERPALWLVGFGLARTGPDQSVEIAIDIPRRTFAYWDNRWVDEPGEYQLFIGTSSAELGEPVVVRLPEFSDA